MATFRPYLRPPPMRLLLWLLIIIASGRVCYQLFVLRSQLGLDSQAYVRASRGLALTGSPYGWGTDQIGPYLYPPLLAIMGMPLNRLSIVSGSYMWVVGAIICTVLLVTILQQFVGWRVAFVSVIAFPPVWSTIIFGQINALIAVIVGIAILSTLDRRDHWTGMWLGIGFLFKLTPGVALLSLAFQKRWQCVAAAAITVVTAIAISLPVTSLRIWQQGFTQASATAWVSPAIVSLTGILTYHYHTRGYIIAQLLAVTLLILTLWRAHYLSSEYAIAASTLFTLLIAPITWEHHVVIVLPVLALMWSRRYCRLSIALWSGLAIVGGSSIPCIVAVGWIACCWPNIPVLHDTFFLKHSSPTMKDSC